MKKLTLTLVIFLLPVILLFQNCAEPRAVSADGDSSGLNLAQKVAYLNTVLVENFDIVFYVNKISYPSGSVFFFETELEGSACTTVNDAENGSITFRCSDSGVLRLTLIAMDPVDFSLTREDFSYYVAAADEVEFEITEANIFPDGREIPVFIVPNNNGGGNGDNGGDGGGTPVILTGAELYQNHCASCHGVLAGTTKPGRSASQISSAISSIVAMQGLTSLTAEEIQRIADAL